MTDSYAVIGNPVEHSLSPAIHRRFAAQTGEPVDYKTLPAPLYGFRATVTTFIAAGGRGLNVTLPFKRQAMELSDTLSARARRAGAVNTLSFGPEGIKGDNTDGTGLIRDLGDNRRVRLRGAHVLILGAGGAVAGVLGPLLDTRPASVLIANRTACRAQTLAKTFAGDGPVSSCALDGIPARRMDLIVNAVSAGLTGETVQAPGETVGPDTCCYDMLYARDSTPFIRWARQAGAALAADGLGMLVEQAAESFLLWRGIRPDTAPVLEQLRRR